MPKISYKPISVNACWQGRRFKTPKYKQFEKDMLFLMPRIVLPAKPYHISMRFGVSSPLSDVDNPVKPTMDLMQKKYGFNDRDVMSIFVEKEIVSKSAEFIEFEILPYKPDERF